MPATQYDRQNLDELIQAHAERLHKLQLQAARFGADAPPHIVVEIERIDAELAQLKQAAAQPISAALVEELGPLGRYQLWMAHIMRLDTDIGRLRRDVMAELHDARTEWRADIARVEGKLDQVLILLAVKRPRTRRKTSAA